MSIFQHTKIYKKLFYSWFVFIFVCVAIFVCLNQIILFYYKNEKIVSKLEINNKKLEKNNIEIAQKNKEYQFLSSERGEEEYYRNIYPVAKDGEKVLLLYSATSSDIEILSTSTDFWTDIKKKLKFFIDNYTNL